MKGRLMRWEGLRAGMYLLEQNLGVGQFSGQAGHLPFLLTSVAYTEL